MNHSHNVLIVGAHHEEIEAECPNIAAALSLAGCNVTILNPIGGWNWTFIRSLGKDGRERTIADATAAAKELGCKKVIWDYPVAQVDRYKGEIMDRMAEFITHFQPEIVLMHWPLDSHADHRTVSLITHHVIMTARNIVPENFTEYTDVKEVYAFQTGVSQAYNFVPDFLVKADEQTMAMAERAVHCFDNTAAASAKSWETNFRTKAAYWGNMAQQPAEALKFLGPKLPLNGFLLAEILKDRIFRYPYQTWTSNPAFLM